MYRVQTDDREHIAGTLLGQHCDDDDDDDDDDNDNANYSLRQICTHVSTFK